MVIVAKSGGDFTSIQSALDSITDASTSNRYLVYVAPGVYSEQVTMKPYVDIQGSGELTTKITYAYFPNEFYTVQGASNAELRFLTVENTGGGGDAIAIFNEGASPRLTHVTASSLGESTNIGVKNLDSSPTMTEVTAIARAGSTNYGVYNTDGSSPTMMYVTAEAHGGSNSYGVYNVADSAPVMTNVVATAEGASSSNSGVYSWLSRLTMTNVTATAWSGAVTCGVYSEDDVSVKMTNVIAMAYVGEHCYGVKLHYSPAEIVNSVLEADDGCTQGAGIYKAGAGSDWTMVNNSRIEGHTHTIVVWSGDLHVGGSQLDGGTVSNAGTLICAGIYDENYAFYPDTCP